MTPDTLASRFEELERYVAWTAEDAALVQSLLPTVKPHFHRLIDDFYAEIQRHPAAANVITGGAEQVARLKSTLVVWLEQLFSGPFDGQYLARRWGVGLRHAQIGLDQVFTNAALSRLRTGLIDVLDEQFTSQPAIRSASLHALMRRIDLDLAIIEDAYQFEFRTRQQQAVTDLAYHALDGFSTNAFLEKVTQLVSATLKIDSCQVWEAVPGSAQLVLRAGPPQSGDAVGVEVQSRSEEMPAWERVKNVAGLSTWRDAAAKVEWQTEGSPMSKIEMVIPGHKGAFGLLVLRAMRPLPLSRLDRTFLESIANIVATAIDRRRAEERSLQAERLATIGQVATGLAHESRNALQRSLACLDLLSLEVEDRPDALDLVRRTQRAQQDLHQLYEEVRGYAAPVVLDRRSSYLPALWREAWNMLAHLRVNRGASLVEDCGKFDCQCPVDPFRITQVLRNIFENALAATTGELAVEVQLSETHLNGGPAISISIHDNGPGLSDEQRRRVFEPFFTTKAQGTGLGMAIAQRLIEAHGGILRVGSGRHKGAEFILILPRVA